MGTGHDNTVFDIVDHVDVSISWLDFEAGIIVNHGHLSISHCSFFDNRGNTSLINLHTIESIEYTIFYNNKHGSILNDGEIWSIFTTLFKDNQGRNDWTTGGIVNFHAIGVISNCEFEDNSGKDGGAILNHGYIHRIVRCLFKRNRAQYFGGAISSVNGHMGLIKRSTFEGNIAKLDGGGFDIYRSKVRSISRCTFEKNIAGRDGGGLFVRGSKVKRITGGEFIDNNAHRHGGGLMLQKNSKVARMKDNRFYGNWAATGIGGGMGVIYNAVLSYGTGFEFLFNKAYEAGGGAYLNIQNGEEFHNVIARGNNAYLEKNDIKQWSIGGHGIFIDADSEAALINVSCFAFSDHSGPALTIHYYSTNEKTTNKGDTAASSHFPCNILS